MTDTTKRQPAGQPTGGQFAGNDRSEAAIALGVRETGGTLTARELLPGDTIVGTSGARLFVSDIYDSSIQGGQRRHRARVRYNGPRQRRERDHRRRAREVVDHHL